VAKPPNLIEPYKSPELDHDKDMAENGGSPTAAKTMYIVIVVVMVGLFALVGIGLHIPTGG
jgi:hypothetical protein